MRSPDGCRAPSSAVQRPGALSRGILRDSYVHRILRSSARGYAAGIWARLKPREQNLYICLLHESERYRTRKLHRTDAELLRLGKISPRSLRDARIKLQEYGLVVCERGRGNVYAYTLCDPRTSMPWPGDPEEGDTLREKNGTRTRITSTAGDCQHEENARNSAEGRGSGI